jgi:predicted acetyltransferase
VAVEMTKSHRPALQVELRRIAAHEKPRLRAALRRYLAELPATGCRLPAPAGLDYPYLPAYWVEASRIPYWIVADGRIVGFVLVNDHVYRRGSEFSVAEFYVEPAWRRRGAGFRAVRRLLMDHPGTWEVPVAADAAGAVAFWDRTLERCAPGRIERLPPGAIRAWPGWLFVVPRADGRLYRDDIEDVRTMPHIYRVTCVHDDTMLLGFAPKRWPQEDGSELIEWFDTCRSRSVLARAIVRWDPPTAFAFVATDGREIRFQLLDKRSYDEVSDRLENAPDLADDDEVQFFYHWAFPKFEKGREPGRAKA